MRVFGLRNRLVNFRVTEEEYERLRRASLASGARSLSEFARAAVLRAASRRVHRGGPVPEPPNLARRVAELEAALRDLLGSEAGRPPAERSLSKTGMEEA